MRCARAAYYGMINFIDDQLGRLFQHSGGVLRDTLVIFTSDHGEMLGDHHLFRKTWPYESSARIPFLVRAPANWKLEGGLPAHGAGGTAGHHAHPARRRGSGGAGVVHRPQPATRAAPRDRRACARSSTASTPAATPTTTATTSWWTGTTSTSGIPRPGREHLFDLDADPRELHDLALDEGAEARLAPWRERLVEVLRGRPEGCVEGDRLVAGQRHDTLLPGYDADRTWPFL